MGIDRVQFHHLIGMDWDQNQSEIEIKLITLILQRTKRHYKFPAIIMLRFL